MTRPAFCPTHKEGRIYEGFSTAGLHRIIGSVIIPSARRRPSPPPHRPQDNHDGRRVHVCGPRQPRTETITSFTACPCIDNLEAPVSQTSWSTMRNNGVKTKEYTTMGACVPWSIASNELTRLQIAWPFQANRWFTLCLLGPCTSPDLRSFRICSVK
jgi:hypothetical protein